MKTTTLANDIYIQGYGTLPKGLKLNVSRFNSRYIYADLNGCTLQLTYKDTTSKRPKKGNIKGGTITALVILLCA